MNIPVAVGLRDASFRFYHIAVLLFCVKRGFEKKKMTLEDVPETTSNAIAPSHDLVLSPARIMVIMVSPNLRVSMYSNPTGEGTSLFSSQMTTQLASIHP